jgi:hypothetical protein
MIPFANAGSKQSTIEKMLAEVPKNRWCLLLLCALCVLELSQCTSDGYQHATISGDSQTRVRVLYDSPKIQSMVEQVLQAEQEYQRGLASLDKTKSLATFLQSRLGNRVQTLAADMGREPGYDVPGRTRFKILLEADVLLYSKVEFEDGSFKGQVGWLSRGSFDDARTHM